MFLELEQVNFTYLRNSPLEKKALDNVSLTIDKGEFVGLIGPMASGKSTLIQLFNELLTPTSGRVLVEGKIVGQDISAKSVRQKIGIVFQNPENQLFEETVFADVAFYPRKVGFEESEIISLIKEALCIVGLDFETFKDRSPFSLSGGEQRRVAIAGVLAACPQMIVLDEPTMGLDYQGRQEILGHLENLHRTKKTTVVLVSHNMDEVFHLAQRLVVLDKGKIIFSGSPKEALARVFGQLKGIGLEVPQISSLFGLLRESGFSFRQDIFELEEAEESILAMFEKKGRLKL